MENHKVKIAFFFALFVLLGGFFLFRPQRHAFPPSQESAIANSLSYPELRDLEGKPLSFKELSAYFKMLGRKKGAKYAFEVLKAVPLPPNTDLHLLAHAIGDELYKQEGAKGIKICTEDFRNACSHSIVIGLLTEKGENAFPEISAACHSAPGGSGAYTMCFHGLGHGVLAYNGYDLKKTITMCGLTGTAAYGNQETYQCISGAIMELISGGFHNPELWETQRKKYFSDTDPLAPCSSDFMPSAARPLCYMYLTPHLWVAAGGNIGSPTPEIFEKAFRFCDLLPKGDGAGRDSCFGGFGKEFIAVVNSRDIRNVADMTDAQYAKIYEWCMLTRDTKGIGSCVLSAMNSLYWGGENDRNGAIRFCGVVRDPSHQHACITGLIGAVDTYIRDPVYKKEFCKELPSQYQKECSAILQ